MSAPPRRRPLLCFPVFLYIAACLAEPFLHVEAPTRVLSDLPCFCDASAATLRASPDRLLLWRSTWDRTLLFEGTLEQPHMRKVSETLNAALFSGQPSQRTVFGPLPCDTLRAHDLTMASVFLMNVYVVEGDELIGFVHAERMHGCRGGQPWYPAIYRIGLAHSTDRGRSWTFLGDIVGVHNADFAGGCTWRGSPVPGVNCNIGGVPYLIVGEWMYVYFNEVRAGTLQPFPGVARARTDSVIAAARRSGVSAWHKYDGHGWAQDGISGLAAPLFLSPVPGTHLDLHNDAAYCTPLGEYLLTARAPVFTGSARDQLYLFRSRDGLTWGRALQLAESASAEHDATFSYFASLDDDASDDCHVVGRTFSIYYIDQHPSTNQLPVYRIRVSVRESR